MMKLIIYVVLLAGIILSIQNVAIGQISTEKRQNKIFRLDDKARQEVIREVISLLNTQYVFPDIAKKLETFIREREKNGAYNNATEPQKFAKTLTDDLQQVSRDQHFEVSYDPPRAASLEAVENLPSTQTKTTQPDEDLIRANYYFKRVERLDGNVGYLDLRGFGTVEESKSAAVCAMSFLADGDAVIIDLRHNYGGDAEMVTFLTSYFFGPDPVELLTFYNRPKNETRKDQTPREIPGKRMPNVDLYVLISGRTASGGEAFAFTMQQLNRATVIGERTTGAGNSSQYKSLRNGFVMLLPVSRVFNPKTDKGWEGVGVQPDVTVRSDKALDTAYLMAVRKLLAGNPSARRKQEMEWLITTLEARSKPTTIPAPVLRSYTGKYGERTITLEDGGELYYQREGRPKMRLLPLSQNLFFMEWEEITRVKFAPNNKGEMTMIVLYDDGQSFNYERSR